MWYQKNCLILSELPCSILSFSLAFLTLSRIFSYGARTCKPLLHYRTLLPSGIRLSEIDSCFSTSYGSQFQLLLSLHELALNSKHKLGFVDGSIPKPNPDANPNLLAAWQCNNDVVFSWLLNFISKYIVESVIYTNRDSKMGRTRRVDPHNPQFWWVGLIFSTHKKISTRITRPA